MSQIDEEGQHKGLESRVSEAGSQLENDSDIDRASVSTEGAPGHRMRPINDDLKHTQETKVEITDDKGNPITAEDDDDDNEDSEEEKQDDQDGEGQETPLKGNDGEDGEEIPVDEIRQQEINNLLDQMDGRV